MEDLRLLIVDDVEDNRLVLNAICKKLKGFNIKEAVDGLDAIAVCEKWHPHIILMDVMMPNLDGFEASKIIKSRFPETIIMVVTAVIDPHMEENMSSIGVAAYVHKPIDKELIRFKIQNFASVLRLKAGQHTKLSHKNALNPFSADIRNFRTIFDINDAEGMMDFGMWILSRCDTNVLSSCIKVDSMIQLFYDLMRHGIHEDNCLSIIVEESFEEIFLTMKFDHAIVMKPKTVELVNDLQFCCIIRENIACVRLEINNKHFTAHSPLTTNITAKPLHSEPVSKSSEPKETLENIQEFQSDKYRRTIDANEQELLRQSFVHKTAAIDYVQEIGGDVLDEIRDLESLDEEWKEKLHTFEADPTIENIYQFTDRVLGVYIRAINNLFEFTALAYALASLGTFMKEHADGIISDPEKLKTLVMMTEHLGADLVSWREHVFELRDTADIHYLDSSFFSSCMQIEQIIGSKEIVANDDDGMEFF
ncbi:MAG: response regulator [Sulfuricurvum sp.]|nr:response regulator [Sulfuricurvum sp.]